MAITHQTASLRSRITCARRWIAVAKEGDLIHAYEKTIELVDQYLLIQSSISTRHQILLDKLIPKSLASDAAATAIAGGEIKKAVQFLEQGRALLWSQMSQYRTPLQELQNVDSNLANEFARLSRLLETSALPQLDNDTSFHSSQLEARTYRQVSDAWRTVVAQIRKLDGFQSFLIPPTYAVLSEAARNGPVIVINISSYRSDAIILHPDGNPHVVPLHVQPQQIEILHSKFSEATRATKPRKVLLGILNTLWDDIVEPIVHKLQDLEIKRGSRIWWCPTSHLAMLPLHAAGHYRRDRPNLPDFYISSYTPTLTALLRSRETNLSRAPSGIPQLLVVAQSLVIDQPRIPSVQSEVETVEKIAPRVDVLHGQNITRDSVLTFLHDHPWVHFTCHGSQKPRPFDSCFHLYDEPLTLMDIMQARLPNAQYAFLSACHSAAGDTDKPDETIHLAAALQFSGFRSVIGTMYAMADEDGPALAEQVYKHMFRRVGKGKGKEGKDEMVVDFRDAAEALHTAVKALREREEGFPLERWINFVHIGV
ncbi:hypothetical protein FRC03_003473 [Tulasnella sp. 419]|nr:hypothetical protein FRC03_003473 [Tulasnella sp. 419]